MLQTIDIINEMLAAIGTAPLTSNDVNHPSYVKASNKLEIVNREVQGDGYWFNTGVRTMKPDTEGEIILPGNTLHADPVDTTLGYIMRNGKLYDPDEAAFDIGKDVDVRFMEVVPIEELPPAPWAYIRAMAVYEFYRDEDGNQPKLGEYYKAMEKAMVKLKREHIRNADVNFFNGTSFAQMRRGYRGNRLPPNSTR